MTDVKAVDASMSGREMSRFVIWRSGPEPARLIVNVRVLSERLSVGCTPLWLRSTSQQNVVGHLTKVTTSVIERRLRVRTEMIMRVAVLMIRCKRLSARMRNGNRVRIWCVCRQNLLGRWGRIIDETRRKVSAQWDVARYGRPIRSLLVWWQWQWKMSSRDGRLNSNIVSTGPPSVTEDWFISCRTPLSRWRQKIFRLNIPRIITIPVPCLIKRNFGVRCVPGPDAPDRIGATNSALRQILLS